MNHTHNAHNPYDKRAGYYARYHAQQRVVYPGHMAAHPPLYHRQKPNRQWTHVRGKILVLLAVIVAFSLAAVHLVSAQRQVTHGGDLPSFSQNGAMPFETAGQNFPGSAFYYLDDDSDYYAPVDVLNDGDFAGTGRLSPMATSFVLNGTGRDHARAVQCLTDAIYYEAGLEPDAGQQAVAQVIINRMKHPSYPNNICGVIYQGSERRTGCQFSFSCDGAMSRKPSQFYWLKAKKVAERALAGYVYAPVGLATHYHTSEVSPYWAPSLDFIGTIGAHRFYRWRGSAGLKSAFNTNYAGSEPHPGPKAKLPLPKSGESTQYAGAMELDPVKLAQAYEESRAAAEAQQRHADQQLAQTQQAAAPPKVQQPYQQPRYSAEAQRRGGEAAFRANVLPQSGGVKEEYRQSGQWKNPPGQ